MNKDLELLLQQQIDINQQLLKQVKDLEDQNFKLTRSITEKPSSFLNSGLFQTIFDTIHDAVFVHDLNGKFVLVNQAACQTLNYSLEEFLSLNLRDIVVLNEKEIYDTMIDISTQKNTVFADYHITKDGIKIPVEVSSQTLYFEGKQVVLSVARNLSEGFRHKEEIIKREEKYRDLFDHMNNAFALHKIVVNDKGEPVNYLYIEANKAFEELTGLPIHNIKGKLVTEVLPNIKNEPRNWIEIYGQVALKGETLTIDEVYVEALGRHYSISAYCPQPGYFATLFRDVSEQIITKEALLDSEKRYKLLSKLAFEAIIIHREGIIIDVNTAFEKLTGYSREEAIGNNLYESLGFSENKQVHGENVQWAKNETYQIKGKRKDSSYYNAEIQERVFIMDGMKTKMVSARNISDVIKTNLKLHESEEKFRSLAETSPSAIMVYQHDYWQYANKAAMDITEYSKQELLEMKFWEFIHPDDQQLVEYRGKKRQQGEKINNNYEFRIISKSGIVKWVDLTATTITFRGTPAVLLSVLEITQRKKAVLALEESEYRFKFLAQSAMEMASMNSAGEILIFSAKKIYEYIGNCGYVMVSSFNKGAKEWQLTAMQGLGEKIKKISSLLGFELTNLKGTNQNKLYNELNFGKLLPLEIDLNLLTNGLIPPPIARAIEQLLSIKQIQTISFKSDFRLFGNITIISTDKTKSINTEFIEAFVSEISIFMEKERTKHELKENEKRYKLLSDKASECILIHHQGEVLDINLAFEKLFGYSLQELKHQNIIDLFLTPEYRQQARHHIKTEYAKPYEVIAVNRQGHHIPVEIEGNNMMYMGKNVRITLIRDLTERKHSEIELRLSEAKFRSVFDFSNIGVTISDTKGICLDVNEEFQKMTGFTKQELLGKSYLSITHADDIEMEMQFMQQMNLGSIENCRFEKRFINKLNEIIWVDLAFAARRKEDGNIDFFIGMVMDITSWKLAEKTLVESESRFRELFQNVKSGVVFTRVVDNGEKGSDYIIQNINNATLKMLNSDLDHTLGYSMKDIWPAIDNYGLVPLLQRVWQTGESGHFPAKLYKDENHENWYEFQVYRLPNNEVVLTYEDVTEKKTAAQQIIASQTRLQLAVKSGGIGTWELNLENNQLSWDDKMFEIYETPKTNFEELYKVWASCLESEALDWVEKELKLANEGEKDLDTEFTISTPKGTTKIIKAFALKSVDKDTGHQKMIGINYDITHIREHEHQLRLKNEEIESKNTEYQQLNTLLKGHVEEIKTINIELKKAKELAEQSDQLKTSFLANMSHEIRTPMNSIMGFSQLLGQQPDRDRVKQFTNIINNSAQQLLSLIDNIILYSRLQTKLILIRNKEFNVTELLSDVVESFNIPKYQKGVALTIDDQDSNNNIRIKADYDKLRQILTNLISNAFKYTSEGTIKVGYTIENDNIIFYVEDTGMGIEKAELKLIFDRFYRGQEVEMSNIRGTGLGLSIVTELIDLMEGKIDVQSEKGFGSKFYFNIPCKRVVTNSTSETAIQVSNVLRANIKVLIAEDEPTNYEYLVALLEDKVASIDHAVNGKVAVEMALKNTYDVILMDIKMPKLNGYEATKQILKVKRNQLIIAQTAYALTEEKNLAYAAGCMGYLTKPIHGDDLLNTLNQVLKTQK